MIYFFADSHYDRHCGLKLFEKFPEELKNKTVFTENRWDILEEGEWEKDCSLLILNMIGGTCSQPHPGSGAEVAMRRYVERGGKILMLHGASAAFWQWSWWRLVCGLRWVRPEDPDKIACSVHPQLDYSVLPAKNRHVLTGVLRPFEFKHEELYIECEQTLPMMVLMEARTAEGWCYPQCVECITPFGGRQIIFLPGHREDSFENPDFIADNLILIDYLLSRD